MIYIGLQFFGGRGSGGGKRSGGGGRGSGSAKGEITQSFSSGSYTSGTKVGYKESDTRYTVSGTGERISKSGNKVIDEQRRNNPNGTATVTTIVQGSKGNLYAVDYTYTPKVGGAHTSEIRRVKRK